MRDHGNRASLAIPLFLAMSLSSTAASASRDTWSTAINPKQDRNILNGRGTELRPLFRANHLGDFTKITLGAFLLQQNTETAEVRLAAGQYAFDPLLPSAGYSLSEFPPAPSRSPQVDDHSLGRRLKLDPLVDVGQPLVEVYRFGETGEETTRYRDAAPEEVDRTTLASDDGGVRFNLTEWLSCVVEAVPLMGDVSVKELNGDPSLNDLRVFGALTTTF